MTSSAEVTLLLTMVVVTEYLNTFEIVKSMPTARQKLLNSTSPTALCIRRNENIQEPRVL